MAKKPVQLPKWVFVKKGGEVKHILVTTQEEHDAVGEYKESPADFTETK